MFLLLGIAINTTWHCFPLQITLISKGLLDHMAHMTGLLVQHCGSAAEPFPILGPTQNWQLLVNESKCGLPDEMVQMQ